MPTPLLIAIALRCSPALGRRRADRAVCCGRARQRRPSGRAAAARTQCAARRHGQLAAECRTRQLQHTVNTRLDAVTPEPRRVAADHDQEHHRPSAAAARAARRHRQRAEEHHRAGHAGDARCKQYSRQQAVARRLRPGPLEAIVADVLPKGAYEFQYTLTNKYAAGLRDLHAGQPAPLVIDAKFPLEAMTAWREATTDDERKQAIARMRTTSASTSPTSPRNT